MGAVVGNIPSAAECSNIRQQTFCIERDKEVRHGGRRGDGDDGEGLLGVAEWARHVGCRTL